MTESRFANYDGIDRDEQQRFLTGNLRSHDLVDLILLLNLMPFIDVNESCRVGGQGRWNEGDLRVDLALSAETGRHVPHPATDRFQ